MGVRKRMRSDLVPHKFDCLKDWAVTRSTRKVNLKRSRLQIVQKSSSETSSSEQDPVSDLLLSVVDDSISTHVA